MLHAFTRFLIKKGTLLNGYANFWLVIVN
uniref:Uncharacterized protein n=1 Tax=Rhizophora mucronata TaxID=61149 RepID=A0A2P2NCL3_RHIMU